MKLYEDKISSAASRVRIALALKGLLVEGEPIFILGTNALNRTPEYLRVNPQGLVPALLTDEGSVLTQSLAIVEYLDERYPEPALLPDNLEARALARSIALSIAVEIHALLPPRVATRLGAIQGVDSNAILAWRHHWISEGMTAIEAILANKPTSLFAVGDTPSIADIFLFPQAVNTERAGITLDQWPHIAAIFSNLCGIPAFADNAPALNT